MNGELLTIKELHEFLGKVMEKFPPDGEVAVLTTDGRQYRVLRVVNTNIAFCHEQGVCLHNTTGLVINTEHLYAKLDGVDY